MTNNYEIEWIPDLLDQLKSVQGLDSALLSDIMLAQACLHANLSLKPKKKIKKKKKSKKILKTPPYIVNLEIRGTLPHNLSKEAFHAAVVPLLEDQISGKVVFLTYTRMRNGTYCYNFQGMCPIHLRHHTDVGPWQIKQHRNSEWCGFKCWKQDSYKKLFSINELCDF